MSGLRDIHLALAGGQRSVLVGLATEAERLGYGGVWVAEGPGRDAFRLLTEIARMLARIAAAYADRELVQTR